MNMLGKLMLPAVLVTVSAGSAFAADLITVPTSAAPAAQMPLVQEAGFDWSGFYGGIYGSAQSGSLSDDTQLGFGVQAGVNVELDYFLLGAEVSVQGLAAGDTVPATTYGQVLGRAGVAVTDNALIYAAGGYGADLGQADEQDVLLGGGVELAISESISLDARYVHGFAIEGDNDKNQFTLGARFHF